MSESTTKAVPDSSVISAVVVVVPAAITYFIGWAYLHFFLNAFGIGILELDLGLETVLIYAAPALTWLLRENWVWLGLLVLFSAAFTVLPQRWKDPGQRVCAFFAQRVGSLPRALRVLLALVLIGVFAMALAAMIRQAATSHAIDRWTLASVKIQAPAMVPGRETAQHQDYDVCLQRKGLDLLIADTASYFMLCPSEIDDTMGVVYEVRRDNSALASVRQVSRPR